LEQNFTTFRVEGELLLAFHIVLPRRVSLSEQSKLAAEDQSPRHALGLIAEQLNATVHQPVAGSASFSIKAAVLAPREMWSLAESVSESTRADDTVFCPSEAGGLQLAATYNRTAKRPKLALFSHNLDRPRAKFALKFWRLDRTIDLFIACSSYQIDFLKRYLRLSNDRVHFIWDHTDDQFFTPGPIIKKKRPLIISVGLEQRDYFTLAAATCNLDADVKISGFSQDARTGIFPTPLPTNMERRFYSWPELRQLYWDADLVVVSCRENKYAAGVQSLMEASACAKPIVVTTTTGLKGYINEAMVAVSPGDADQMQNAIRGILADPLASKTRASHAYATSRERFSMDRYVEEICQLLQTL
jgi:glycosyltransferase involved in cell wall biosynthesis